MTHLHIRKGPAETCAGAAPYSAQQEVPHTPKETPSRRLASAASPAGVAGAELPPWGACVDQGAAAACVACLNATQDAIGKCMQRDTVERRRPLLSPPAGIEQSFAIPSAILYCA